MPAQPTTNVVELGDHAAFLRGWREAREIAARELEDLDPHSLDAWETLERCIAIVRNLPDDPRKER